MPVKEVLTPAKHEPFSSYADKVRLSVTSSLDNVLRSATYDASEVSGWVDTLTASKFKSITLAAYK